MPKTYSSALVGCVAYIGGGGYIKLAWDLLKRPLVKARADHVALPHDMHGPNGEPIQHPCFALLCAALCFISTQCLFNTLFLSLIPQSRVVIVFFLSPSSHIVSLLHYRYPT